MRKERNTVDRNREIWDRTYAWPEDGDEWTGHALYSGVSYEEWKRSLVDDLIRPNAEGADVLEIGCGRGRWSAEILRYARALTLVDVGANSLQFCRERFRERGNVRYYVTDGRGLPADATESIDFVWSFAAFVHMEGSVIDSYLGEIHRVLRPGGRAIIHHAGRRHAALPLGWLRRVGEPGRRLFRVLSMGFEEVSNDGWRSNVSARMVAESAASTGLALGSQLTEWRPGFGVPRFLDVISVLDKPAGGRGP